MIVPTATVTVVIRRYHKLAPFVRQTSGSMSEIAIYRQLSSESLMLSSDVVHHLLCRCHHGGWSLAHVMMCVHYNLPPTP